MIIDTQSKHIDTHFIPSTSSFNAIEKLRQTLSTHGYPNIIVSDNGREFKQSRTYNDIKSIHSSPFHPPSNGLAEKVVQTIKSGLKKVEGDLDENIYDLHQYRITPHFTTGELPAVLLMKCIIHSRLSSISPNVRERVMNKVYSVKQSQQRTFVFRCRPTN